METILAETIDLDQLADILPLHKSKLRQESPRDRTKWHVTSLLDSAQEIIRGRCVY
jgi:hypothetical protein